MSELYWVFASIFLPLFPMGMLFNSILQKIDKLWIRVLLIFTWPLPGVLLLEFQISPVPKWVIYWALFSALLYGFRSLVIKDIGIWIGFLATSTWALSWIIAIGGFKSNQLLLHILAFAFPLLLLTVLVAEIKQRYKSVYVSVVSGLAQSQPRLSFFVVIAILAAIGSPMFPSFFSVLNMIAGVISLYPLIAMGIGVVWLLWSWSSIALLQQLLVEAKPRQRNNDIGHAAIFGYGASVMMIVVSGMYMSRILL